jgi:hypothetical protein
MSNRVIASRAYSSDWRAMGKRRLEKKVPAQSMAASSSQVMPTWRPFGTTSFSEASITASASSWAGQGSKGMSLPLSFSTIRQWRTNSTSGGTFTGRQLPTRAMTCSSERRFATALARA